MDIYIEPLLNFSSFLLLAPTPSTNSYLQIPFLPISLHLLYNIAIPKTPPTGGFMFTPTEEKLIELLGQNLTQVQAARALGLEESEVSRHLANKDLALAVSEKKVATLTAATKRDANYDTLEDKLAAKLDQQLPFIQQPVVTAKILQMVNGLKRRGATQEDTNRIGNQTTIVVLQLPQVTRQKFEVNNRNEVVQVGDRPMLTIDSNQLLKSQKEKHHEQLAITEI